LLGRKLACDEGGAVRKRNRTALLVFGACGAAIAIVLPLFSGAHPARAAPQRPNVLIFLADDQPMGTMRVSVRLRDGSIQRRDVMPHVLDMIGREGITFRRGYISNPLCCPSRSSILTGLYSKNSGVYTNGEGVLYRSFGGDMAFETNGNATRTIPYVLEGAGYETALFGKYLNGYLHYSNEAPNEGPYFIPAGWDYWRAFYANNGKYYNYDLISWERGQPASVTHYDADPSDNSTTVVGAQLRSWLSDRDASVPFFAYVAPYSPHPNAVAEPRDVGRFRDALPFRSPALNETEAEKSDMPRYIRERDLSAEVLQKKQDLRRRQLDSLFSFDREIGRTVKLLDGLGQLDNTIVIYLSDNGLMWGEHDWTYKMVPYERSTHVPYYLRFDGLGDGSKGVVDRDLVVNVDLAPTIYDLTLGGSPPDLALDGVDMLTGAANRRGIYLEHLIQSPVAPSYCGFVSADGWKYVVYTPYPGLIDPPFEEELYELNSDPHELHNLAGNRRYASVRHAMRVALAGSCSLPDATPDWYDAWQP
jgi:arylsulfatase A-like enzyme